MSGQISFQLQSGVVRETVLVDIHDTSLLQLRKQAVKFITKHYPRNELGDNLADHILLYKHDFRSVNILQLLVTGEDLNDGTLVEIVISPCAQHERLVVHPHTLFVHSYKTPTFCDFCGELLFGLVKQGLKCQGCGLNYHKRCASKIPNNCNGSRQRRPSAAIPLSPRNSVGIQHSFQPGGVLLATASNANSAFLSDSAATSSSCSGECVSARTSISTTMTTLAAGGSSQLAPEILITADQQNFSTEDGDAIGGNHLQMPRKDRSSSWSGRPLWMEIAEATRVKVPHTFQVHSYKRPTVCQHCKKLLKGLIRQGIQCRDCKYNCHKKCAQYVAKDCSGNTQDPQNALLGSGADKSGPVSNFGGSMENLGMRISSMSYDDRTTASNEDEEDEEDEENEDYRTRTQALDEGSPCNEEGSLKGMHKKTQSTPSAPLQRGGSGRRSARFGGAEQASPPPDEDNVNESQNIPLMRIVMSKKQTKRPNSKVLKEGWMLHYTAKHSMRKKHYWRLDTKSIVMFKDENSPGYYKELPLSEILEVKISPLVVHTELKKELTHYFEIHTHTSIYFIAGAPCSPDAQTTSTTPNAGKAPRSTAENAAAWATAIKHALMPVTPQSSGPRTDSKGLPPDMVQLKVPIPGETGHLGIQIRSEAEFSQLYQIFADEILGSGQFGTVYGGIQRKDGRHVAVKLIEKLKFPSNKEAALRTEVEILQKVRHPGVVEFQQMLETQDRIFVVMEKLKGDMLEMILSSERGRLSERITQYLVHQILISLRYLHNMNIVHCDLKPENILLTSDSDFPQVKLCDFGFARIIGERSFRRSVVGTPAYLAPEVLRNKGFNRSLDMWSVGVIVYVSLSGTFPFNEDEDINDQIQNAEFMYPPNPWKEVSANAIEFINSLLQVKMSKRLTVSKALSHIWLQSYDLWSDLRTLEKDVGERFVTHESDDARWAEYEKEHGISPVYL